MLIFGKTALLLVWNWLHILWGYTHTHFPCVLHIGPQSGPPRPVVQTEGTYCLKCCLDWSSAYYCSCCPRQTDSDCQSHLASQSPPSGGCRISGMRSTRIPAYLNTHTHTKRNVIINSRSLANLIGAKEWQLCKTIRVNVISECDQFQASN